MLMSNFKNNIATVLADEAILQPTSNRHSNPSDQLELTEEGTDATLKRLKLTHIKNSDTCITFDVTNDRKFKTYSAYLKSSNNSKFNKRCDFIIARKQEDTWQVYFCDLKSRVVKKGDVLKQLLASQLFFDYLLAIMKFEFDNQELSNYEANFVCIHDNSNGPLIQKGPTIPGNSKPYSKEIADKKLTIIPVGVAANGQAKVSFNKIA